ncbi:MAG: FKBP-type peptidyl-prolyl cis-trans isomerase, partial [Bacteroidota bacterium]
KTGDYVEIKLSYSNNKDSILFNSNDISSTIKMRVNKPSHKACFEEAVSLLKIGERALFKISADSFFIKTKKTAIPQWVIKGEEFIFDIELIKILDKNDVIKEEKLQKERRKKEEDEATLQYIKKNNIKEAPSISGLYYIESKPGNGKQTEPGDILQVHYTGKLIDGRIFDSSIDRNETFVFHLGKAEVIAGWEEGFSHMKEGGKAEFIIPSHLAYGEKGYGKIIPPYSTLIFDVELVKIN